MYENEQDVDMIMKWPFTKVYKVNYLADESCFDTIKPAVEWGTTNRLYKLTTVTG